MDLHKPRSPQILRVLRACAGSPIAFRRLLYGLDSTDLEDTWKLAFELAKVDHAGVQESAHYLAQWCTRRLLDRISKQGVR